MSTTSLSHDRNRYGITAGIYVGGPIYKNSYSTIATLQASGFSEIIVWNISINDTGDLNFNYEFPLIENGRYIGNNTHTEFQKNIASLKNAPSSVSRITFSIGSSNIGVFENIKTLISTQGTGINTALYQNFLALKKTFPNVDAIDFDDENCYDEDSMVSFAVMLGNIGFEVSLCPYTNNNFWISVAARANKLRFRTVTAVLLGQ